MARTHGAGRLRSARGSRGVISSVGRFSIRLLQPRSLREGLARRRAAAERRPRRRRGCCCEYGSPGLLYEDARFREGAVPRAGLSDAARPLVCREASLVRGRVSGESAALYLWGAALLVSCSNTARGPRGDGVQASTDVPRPRPTGDGRSGAALDTSPVAREDDPEHRKKEKKRIRSTSWRNTLEKPTAGDAPCRNRYGKARR